MLNLIFWDYNFICKDPKWQPRKTIAWKSQVHSLNERNLGRSTSVSCWSRKTGQVPPQEALLKLKTMGTICSRSIETRTGNRFQLYSRVFPFKGILTLFWIVIATVRRGHISSICVWAQICPRGIRGKGRIDTNLRSQIKGQIRATRWAKTIRFPFSATGWNRSKWVNNISTKTFLRLIKPRNSSTFRL